MKFKITLSFSVICSLLAITFGLVNLKVGKTIPGWAELGSGLGMSAFSLYSLLYKKNCRNPIRLLTTLVIIIAVYLYWNGGFNHTGDIWTLALPSLFFSLQEIKKGLILTVCFPLLIGILFILSSLGIITVAYTGIESLTALLVYSLISFILFSYENNRNQDKKQIATLEDLLPICSHCKKILDDQGNWQPVDDYMHRKRDVSFSHGICPNCLKELYPDLVDGKGQIKK